MMLHPDVQAPAQAEVDGLIAREQRLPEIRDRKSLPYLDAIMKEVLRWATPAPVGLFHCSAADDEYNGFYIPAKTTVISNIWAMFHNPDEYPDPFKFDPERFIASNGGGTAYNPLDITFGFGRRICPGQHVAEASMFIQMATFLAILNVAKGVGEDGREIEPEIEFTTTIVRYVYISGNSE